MSDKADKKQMEEALKKQVLGQLQQAQGQKQGREETPMNSKDGWDNLRLEWAQTQIEKLQAHADRFFTTDDDLRLSHHILLVFVTAFFIVFVLWANFATLDEVTRGNGKVIPSSEIQILQSLEGGIVDEFLVSEGDPVEAGQVLMRLRDIQASSDLGANQQRYMALQAKITRLKAEADGRNTLEFSEELTQGVPGSVNEEWEAFEANKKNRQSQLDVLEQQLSQRKQEITELTTRIEDLKGVIALSREERNMIAPLVEKGSAPKLELVQLERGLKQQQTELNSLETSLPRLRSAVEESQARINEIESASQAEAQRELAAATGEMNTIEQTLGALEDRKTRTEIRAPVNGTVKDIKMNTVGGVVQSGAPLIEVVPRDDQLIIEARIRPADIAFLHPGQKAVVKITAYDYSIYGGLGGELVDISADTITDEQGETFYRVRIRTPETYLKHKGRELEIIPGMVASVDILTGKKTVMDYIMKPFIKTLDSAMRER